MKNFGRYIIILSGLLLMGEAHAQLSFSQKRHDFGQVEWQTEAQAHVTVVNKGKRPLSISDIRTSNSALRLKWPSQAIAAGASADVEVTLSTHMAGTFCHSLSLYAEGDSVMSDQMLVGGVVPMPGYKPKEAATVSEADYPYHIGDICLSTDYAEFDEVHEGTYSQQEIFIYNKGKDTYLPELMHMPRYLTAMAVPERLHGGRTGKIVLTVDGSQLPDMGLTQTNIYLSRHPGDNVCKDNELAVSAVKVPAHDSTAVGNDASAPVLSIPSATIQMSSFSKKGVAKGKITLRNIGKTPLEISNMQVFNPGLSMSYVKVLSPGASAKLSVTVQRDLMKTSHNPLRILMVTNDPRHSKVIFTVSVAK